MDADGRLHTIPSKHAKLLVVLDHLAQSFEPGQRYEEAEVNLVLRGFHDDYAALRRYLVETTSSRARRASTGAAVARSRSERLAPRAEPLIGRPRSSTRPGRRGASSMCHLIRAPTSISVRDGQSSRRGNMPLRRSSRVGHTLGARRPPPRVAALAVWPALTGASLDARRRSELSDATRSTCASPPSTGLRRCRSACTLRDLCASCPAPWRRPGVTMREANTPRADTGQ